MTNHDDEVLGKAYDARLMRRLAHYLRRYWRPVVLSFVAIVIGAAAQLAQPYLMKVAIDQYIATGQLAPLDRLAALYLVILIVAFVRRLRADVDPAADRAEADVRPADGPVSPSAAARPEVLRPQPGRPADDARHVRRRRAERSVHGRRCHGVRRRAHPRRHHGRDAVDGLAAGPGGLLRAADHRG